MIRVVPLDEFDTAFLGKLCKALYAAFGVGSEPAATVNVPAALHEPFDASKLLDQLPKVPAFPDDKVLFLTARKLAPRKLFSGEAPTTGLARYGGQRAILSLAHVKTPGDDVEKVARYALQEVGHAFGLHHCLDARCAMHPTWTPSFSSGAPIFCGFCRDRIDQTVRLAKS